MLVLTRKPDQRLTILAGGQRIEVVVVKVKGKEVRLGVVADRSVDIKRSEIDGKEKAA